MSTEDFSFPTNNFPCTIDSPPLWRLTSATSSDSSIHEETSKQGLENEEEEDDDDDYKSINFGQRKSFSCVEEKIRYDESSKKKEEEKMDMLWEDFNEELMPRNKSYKSDDSDYHHKLSKGYCKINLTVESISRCKAFAFSNIYNSVKGCGFGVCLPMAEMSTYSTYKWNNVPAIFFASLEFLVSAH